LNNKREQILEAGRSLILSDGYAKTKIEKITHEVKIAKGSFYNYFDSKENFLLALIAGEIEERKREMNSLLEKGESLEDNIREMVYYRMDISPKTLKLELVLYSLIRNLESLTSNIRKVLIEYEREKVKVIEYILEKYREKLEIKEANDIRRYALLINSMIRSYKGSKFYIDTEEKYFISSSPEKVVEKVATLELEKEKEFLTKSIIQLIKGGEK
jgi:AcrR family transcriptional regulator